MEHVEQSPAAGEGFVLHPSERRPLGHGLRWISQAWDLFTANWLLWIAGTVVLGIIHVALGMIPGVGMLVQLVLTPVVYAGPYLVAQRADYAQPREFSLFFGGFRESTARLLKLGMWNLLLMALVGLATGLVAWAVVGQDSALVIEVMQAIDAGERVDFEDLPAGLVEQLALVMLVFLLFLVPYLAAMWFATPLVLFAPELAPSAALAASLKACVQNILPMLVYGGVMLLLVVAATMLFGIGLLIVWPLALITGYTSLHDIFVGASEERFQLS